MRAQHVAPPPARRDPVVRELHGDRFVDEFAWIKDRTRSNPEVLALLEAENAYLDATLAHTQDLQNTLNEEMRARIVEDDQTVPYEIDGWLYYARIGAGQQYWIHCRRHGSMDAPEEILLDENELAEGHEQFRLGAMEVSPDHRLLAYSTDTTGAEEFTLFLKDLGTGDLLPDRVEGLDYPVMWGNDAATLYYVTFDTAKRPDKLWRHRLGSPQTDDEQLLHEQDLAFYVSATKTRSRRYIVINIWANATTELRYLDADDPSGELRILAERRDGIELSADHQGDRFVVLTNEGAKNFRMMTVPCDDPARANWREILPHRPGVKLDEVDAFAGHFVVAERERGLTRLRILSADGAIDRYIDFPEPTYSARAMLNPVYGSTTVRFSYSSLVTPPSVFDEDMNTGARELRKQLQIPSGFDASLYVSERIWARAPDGVEVPISFVARRDRAPGGPLLLYGYGSYGASLDATFSLNRLSLLDRGFAFAIAHIRGGGELGEEWRDTGKLRHKQNTFSDFIACAEHLIARGDTTPEGLAIMGGSAGGLLIGAVVNQRPELFRAAVAQVPFVDAINTVLDPELLFSVMEYDEWGNPSEAEAYEWIRAYSPYENVDARPYPTILATTGLHDPRVNYWEPAKWVQRLRALSTSGAPVLLKTKMVAGHYGASGRYDALADVALEYAFLFDALGVAT